MIRKNPLESKRAMEGKKTPCEKRSSENANIVKEEVKKSLANVIKVYYPEKKAFLDVSMTEVTNDLIRK